MSDDRTRGAVHTKRPGPRREFDVRTRHGDHHRVGVMTISTAGALTSSTECIAARELPHAGEELREAAAENSHADNYVRRVNVADLDVVHG